MLRRLEQAGASAPPTALAYRFNATAFKAAASLRCDNAKTTNFIQPIDL